MHVRWGQQEVLWETGGVPQPQKCRTCLYTAPMTSLHTRRGQVRRAARIAQVQPVPPEQQTGCVTCRNNYVKRQCVLGPKKGPPPT